MQGGARRTCGRPEGFPLPGLRAFATSPRHRRQGMRSKMQRSTRTSEIAEVFRIGWASSISLGKDGTPGCRAYSAGGRRRGYLQAVHEPDCHRSRVAIAPENVALAVTVIVACLNWAPIGWNNAERPALR